MTVDSSSYRVVPLPGVPSSVGLRAAVDSRTPAGPGLLEIDEGGRTRTVAIDLQALDGVPQRLLALPQEAFEDLGLDHAPGWRLRKRDVVDATRLVLELITETPAEQATRDLTACALGGTLLRPDSHEPLTIGDTTFVVRETEPATRGDLLRIGGNTRIEVCAPQKRSDVDMVILADVSWSMNINDLNGNRQPYLRRIDGLKEALCGLLDARGRALGSGSRVALLEFDDDVRQRFPASGGMAGLGEGAPKSAAGAFCSAVGKLEPRRGTATNIQRALHRASELLYQHGSPANERVIVLVSDGADLPSYRADQTGKVLDALDEPVSLMHHLYRGMKIRLHAVGMSSRELYKACFRDEPPGCVPDHRLLQRLVTAGGGAAPTVGGIREVQAFFHHLRADVRHPVPGRVKAAPPIRLDPAARKLLQRYATRHRTRPAPDIGKFIEAYVAALAAGQELYGESWLQLHSLRELRLVLLDDVPDDPAQFRKVLRTQLRRLAPDELLDSTGGHLAVRNWSKEIRQLERALAEGSDLAGLAALCRGESRDPGDVGRAVLCWLQPKVDRLATELRNAAAKPRQTQQQGKRAVAGLVAATLMKD